MVKNKLIEIDEDFDYGTEISKKKCFENNFVK